MRDLTSLARKASSQHGLLSRRQLIAAGFTDRQIHGLQRDGTLTPRRRGVHRFRAAPPGWEQDLMSACIAVDPPGIVSHRSALRCWGLRTVADELEVSVRYPRSARIEGVHVHRSRDLTISDITYIDGLPVTTPSRTLVDAGAVLSHVGVRRLVDHALSVGLVTATDLVRYRRRVGRQGRDGAGVMREVLESLPAGVDTAESGPEIDVRRLCAERGLPEPVAQHPVRAGGHDFRLDLAFPEQRVGIEYDGFAHHRSPDQLADDHDRQNLLVVAGWTLLRLTAADLRLSRRNSTAATIARALSLL